VLTDRQGRFMPVHDWTRVDAGIFHAFHHEWITEIGRALNRGLLPPEYYALPEQQAAGFGPDALTLQAPGVPSQAASEGEPPPSPGNGSTGLLLAPPRVRFSAESTGEFYRRKKSTIVVRHVSGDRIIAVVEILSPGNKASQHAFRALIDKACELLEYRIHLLIIDLFPPDKLLTLAAYESALTVKAYIEPVAVGDVLPEMPLYLEPGAHILVPLEATYQAAFASVPERWRRGL
jgi:Protein of unknown function (DUF4058)